MTPRLHWIRSAAFVGVACLLAPGWTAVASYTGMDDCDDDDGLKSESNLVPPLGAPDADAFGKVEISKDGFEQEFHVRGQNLDTASPPGPFETWLEDGVGSGVYNMVAPMVLTDAAQGRWELKLESNAGAPPGLGVADVADLTGRTVQVRDTGGATVYLTGIVGTLGGGSCPKQFPALKGEKDLQRPASQPDPDAKGRVKMEKKGHEQKFEVKGERLDTAQGSQFDVFLESGVGTGVYNGIGGMSLKHTFKGEWRLELEGDCEAPPILGVDDLSDLVGRRVEIRNKDGNAVLWGTIPQLLTGAGQLNFNHKSNLSPPSVNPPSPKAKGFARSRYIAKKGQSEFEVVVHQLSNGKTYSLWMEDAVGSGVFVKIQDFGMKGKSGKNGRIDIETKKGEALPFGVDTVAGLEDRKIEVRDQQDVVHLTGVAP
jgi:hypothetical protein